MIALRSSSAGSEDARRSAPGRLSAGADRRDEARCEGSPKSEFRREAASRFRGAELQQAVSAPAREGGFEPAGNSVIKPRNPPAEIRDAARQWGVRTGTGVSGIGSI